MAKASYLCARCKSAVQLVERNRASADRKAAWHEAQGHLCSDCEETDRQAASLAAAEANAANGLPKLNGSARQIAWAETIRHGRLQTLDAAIACLVQRAEVPGETYWEQEVVRAAKRDLAREFQYDTASLAQFRAALAAKADATWWIEHRVVDFDALARMEAYERVPQSTALPLQLAVEAEALLKPAGELASEHIAEIRHVGNSLTVEFAERNEDLRRLMRDRGYMWLGGKWVRVLHELRGDPIDIQAELAHLILSLGIMVRLYHEEARLRALAGNFKPEQRRWVLLIRGGEHHGWLRIFWPHCDDLYDAAKRIIGTRWKNGCMYAPRGAIVEVADFAERYGFALTDDAKQALEDHRQAIANGAVVTDPIAPLAPLRVRLDGVPKPIKPAADAGVDPELKD